MYISLVFIWLIKMVMLSNATGRTSLPAPTDYDASRPIGDAIVRPTAPTHPTNHPTVVSFISRSLRSNEPTRLSVTRPAIGHCFRRFCCWASCVGVLSGKCSTPSKGNHTLRPMFCRQDACIWRQMSSLKGWTVVLCWTWKKKKRFTGFFAMTLDHLLVHILS